MFKKITLIFSSGLLKIVLFVLAISAAGWLTFGSPDTPKKALDDSGVYDTVVENILEEAKQSAKEGGEELPLDEPEIASAIEKALPPAFLQQNAEQVFDSVYAWLDGSQSQPTFTLDLSDAKQTFINGASEYAASRAEELPVCTVTQLRELGTEIDPFNAPCRPPTLSVEQLRKEAAKQLATQDEFLADTVITAEDLPRDENGKTIVDNLSDAPRAYQQLGLLPWFLTALAVVLTVAVLLLSDDKRKAMKSLGITYLVTGFVLLLGVLLSSGVLRQATQPGAVDNDNNAFSQSLVKGVRSLNDSYNERLRWFYISYLAVGTLLVAVYWYTGRGREQNNTVDKEDKQNTADDKPPTEKVEDVENDKPGLSHSSAPKRDITK